MNLAKYCIKGGICFLSVLFISSAFARICPEAGSLTKSGENYYASEDWKSSTVDDESHPDKPLSFGSAFVNFDSLGRGFFTCNYLKVGTNTGYALTLGKRLSKNSSGINLCSKNEASNCWTESRDGGMYYCYAANHDAQSCPFGVEQHKKSN